MLHTSLSLIIHLDREVFQVVGTSLSVSGRAVVFGTVPGVPAGLLIAVGRLSGRRARISLLNTLMALPTVVVGLLVCGFLTRKESLGR